MALQQAQAIGFQIQTDRIDQTNRVLLMLQNILTYLQFGNRFCGVEISSKNRKDIMYSTLLKKSKKEIDIENSFEASSIDGLIPKLPKGQAVFLVINNDHVITKQITDNKTDPENLAYKAFPNINIDEFFFEAISQKTTHFVSICRKTYVNEWVGEFNGKHISVIGLSLGNSMVSSVASYVGQNEITSSNGHIVLEHGDIKSIEKTKDNVQSTYNLNGIEVTSTGLLSFGGALSLVLKQHVQKTNFDALQKDFLDDYNQQRFHALFLKFALGFVLTALLVNFLFFNHYYNEVNRLQQTSQVNASTKQKVMALNEDVGKTQKLVEDMLKSGSSKSSYYVDAIMQGLPESILLNALDYQPLAKRIRPEQPIEIEKNTVLISGESTNSDEFSRWLALMESNGWVKQVDILNYQDVSANLSNFIIKLTMTNVH